jgi:hypothetical protein
MRAISAIRVLNFTGKREEWSTWSQEFLVKARRSDSKNITLANFIISKTNEEINEKKDEEKIKLKFCNSNELAYTELIIFIIVRIKVVKWSSTWLKGARIKIIQRVLQQWVGKG